MIYIQSSIIHCSFKNALIINVIKVHVWLYVIQTEIFCRGIDFIMSSSIDSFDDILRTKTFRCRRVKFWKPPFRLIWRWHWLTMKNWSTSTATAVTPLVILFRRRWCSTFCALWSLPALYKQRLLWVTVLESCLYKVTKGTKKAWS